MALIAINFFIFFFISFVNEYLLFKNNIIIINLGIL